MATRRQGRRTKKEKEKEKQGRGALMRNQALSLRENQTGHLKQAPNSRNQTLPLKRGEGTASARPSKQRHSKQGGFRDPKAP